jgi:hypothetical protein
LSGFTNLFVDNSVSGISASITGNLEIGEDLIVTGNISAGSLNLPEKTNAELTAMSAGTQGEIYYDTDNDTLVYFDGTTVGGITILTGASGVAPDADLLDGQDGSYYLDARNHTNITDVDTYLWEGSRKFVSEYAPSFTDTTIAATGTAITGVDLDKKLFVGSTITQGVATRTVTSITDATNAVIDSAFGADFSAGTTVTIDGPASEGDIWITYIP